VRSAPALEGLGRVSTVLLDKTGTLTRGKPRVIEAKGKDEAGLAPALAVLSLPAERATPPPPPAHPEHARGAALFSTKMSIEDHEELAGLGVRGKVDGQEALAGKRELLASRGVSFPESLERRASELDADGATVVHVALGGEAIALVALRDEPRP